MQVSTMLSGLRCGSTDQQAEVFAMEHAELDLQAVPYDAALTPKSVQSHMHRGQYAACDISGLSQDSEGGCRCPATGQGALLLVPLAMHAEFVQVMA